MEKKQLRSDVRASLQQIGYSEYKERSMAIGRLLFQEPSIIEGKTIAVTMSNRPEVDTTMIIEELWRQGKRVCVPKCTPKTREMAFYEIDGFFQTERSYMDILEPIEEMTELVSKDEIDVIIVPGIVFDPKGYRIGYGGGYYDRFIPGFNGELISIAFEEQVIEQVPYECHDIPVHSIVTDKKRIRCL